MKWTPDNVSGRPTSMNLNGAALKIMAAKGLTLDDVAEIVSANEQTRDPTAAERQARCRARKRPESQRNVTRDPFPNEDNLTLTEPSPTPSGVDPKPVVQKLRGTRLPNDWQLPDDWAEWAVTRRFWLPSDIAEEALLFANYWQARSGAGAVHRDWFKTWQNWVVKSHRKDGEIPKYTAPRSPAEAHAWWVGQASFYRNINREDDAKRCDEHAEALEVANPELAAKVTSLVGRTVSGMRVSKARAA